MLKKNVFADKYLSFIVIWKDEVNKTLGDGTVYITMLRDPVDVFESLWNYSGMRSFYHMELEKFAKSPKIGLLAQVEFFLK